MRRNWIWALFALSLVTPFFVPGASAVNEQPGTGELLGENVSLQFSFGGESTTITTADAAYAISAKGRRQDASGSSRQEDNGHINANAEELSEFSIDLSGTVIAQPDSDRLLVTCHGTISVFRVTSSTHTGGDATENFQLSCTIDGSAYAIPGKPVVIARSGGEPLELTVQPVE